jgi:asparagine synthase (glutamine-hydrolysing)
METSYLETHFKSLLIHKPVVTKLNDILYADALEGGLQELLRYADRNAMAFGRELRLPFLFHELVAFVFSLPSGFKIREGYTKWLLRSYARNKLPASIVWRKGKTGFEPPQAAWMMHEKVRVQISLAKQKLVDHHILRPAVLKKSIIPGDAYALENYDWRYWMASFMI